jgi:mannose-6-phosphate isomerase-like protein (cupin superfamily)
MYFFLAGARLLASANNFVMKPQSVHAFQEWFETLHTTAKSQVAMMRLQPGMETGAAAETHPESDQVMLVMEGAVCGEVAEEEVMLRQGEFMVIPANVPHRFYNNFAEPVLTFNVYATPAYPPHTKG